MKDKPQTREPFTVVSKGDVVEVWLGTPDDAESELVMTLHRSWIPQMIAALRNAQ